MYDFTSKVNEKLQKRFDEPPELIEPQDREGYKMAIMEAMFVIDETRREWEENRRMIADMASKYGMSVYHNL